MTRVSVWVRLTACAGGMALALACTAAQAQAPAPASAPAASTGGRIVTPGPGDYYIEFRAVEGGVYGHSYIAYGRLGPGGRPAEVHYAGLEPEGGILGMAFGHVVPVGALVTPSPGTMAAAITDSFRHRITAADYQRIAAAVRRVQTDKSRYWHAEANNCNDFVAHMARLVGLKAPMTFQLSYLFIPELRSINSGGAVARPAGAPARKPAPKPSTSATPAPSGQTRAAAR